MAVKVIMAANRITLTVVLILVFNFIPHSPDGLNVLGRFKGISHLLTQMPDMHCNGVVVLGVVFLTPDTMEQFF